METRVKRRKEDVLLSETGELLLIAGGNSQFVAKDPNRSNRNAVQKFNGSKTCNLYLPFFSVISIP